jgi:predicted Zn-dependent peptidase
MIKRLTVVTFCLLLGVVGAIGSLDAQAPDRSRLPVAGPAPALKLPAIQKRQLGNGLPVWIVEHHEVPVVQVNLLVLSGTGDDPAGRFGIASLTAAMLTEGAGPRSSLELADAIDFLGADLNASSGVDSSGIRLHVPVTRLADALPLMADVAQRPTFPREELERLRQQRLITLLQSRDDPDSIASLAFSRVIYGPSHRYGTALMGTADTIKAFTPDDLRAFYQSAYRPENSTLIVVGDVVPDKVLPLLEAQFGKWKGQGTAVAKVALPAVPAPTSRQLVVIDKPGAAQSQIRIGSVAVPRSTPDFFPIQVMNTVLGGAFSSRLNLNLRERNGYTYGANSRFDMRKFAGPFVAAAGVQTDKTAEALTEFFNELKGMLAAVPADELARAKNYVALRFPTTFETTSDISGRLEALVVYDLPDDYYSTYVQMIQAVTAADVQRVAAKYLQPDRVTVVVVGDKKTIDPRIRALNLAPIREMAIDEVFAPARPAR